MVKVQFPITVKYNRVTYPPYTDILADEADLAEMKKAGAVVFEEEPVDKAVPEEVPAPKATKPKTQRKPKAGKE